MVKIDSRPEENDAAIAASNTAAIDDAMTQRRIPMPVAVHCWKFEISKKKKTRIEFYSKWIYIYKYMRIEIDFPNRRRSGGNPRTSHALSITELNISNYCIEYSIEIDSEKRQRQHAFLVLPIHIDSATFCAHARCTHAQMQFILFNSDSGMMNVQTGTFWRLLPIYSHQ